MQVAIIGRGKLGRALARALRAVEVKVSLLRGRGSRTEKSALQHASIIWIAVPDPFIREVDARIASHLTKQHTVVHASGSWGSELLALSAAAGAHIAVCHPLVSFGPRTALRGATFVFDGDSAARRELKACVAKLGAFLVTARVHGPRYHAAAALLANGATALAAEAERWLVASGFPAKHAPRALGFLLASVAQNIAEMGPRAALTGPISRGDALAVARHLKSLTASERLVYASVAPLILKLAREGGLVESRAIEVQSALSAVSTKSPRKPLRSH